MSLLTQEDVKRLMKPVANKYKRSAAEDRTLGGRVYDSKAEMAFACQLELWKKAGAINRIWEQVPYPIQLNGIHICNYVADFKVEDASERIKIYEVKGCETPVYRLKMRLLKAAYPDLDIQIVRNGKIVDPSVKVRRKRRVEK